MLEYSFSPIGDIIMRIQGLTVCVDYAEQFAMSIEIWRNNLDDLIVVTTERDTDTINLCNKHGVKYHCTNAFYEFDAKFNKGRAMSEAFDTMDLGSDDWVLFFDSDIIPPSTIKSDIKKCNPISGKLYGAPRTQFGSTNEQKSIDINTPPIHFRTKRQLPVGYFQLFHSQDINAKIRPVMDTFYSSAAMSDVTFSERWKQENLVILKILVEHVGESYVNWLGVNNKSDIKTHGYVQVLNIPEKNEFTLDWSNGLQQSLARIYGEKQVKKLTCMEIGSFEGRGTKAIFEYLCSNVSSRIICVDPMLDAYEQNSSYTAYGTIFNKQYRKFVGNTEYMLSKRTLYKGTSNDVLKKLSVKLDFAYVYGDHSADGVYNDACMLLPLMNELGVILFDDYLFTYDGVNTKEGIDRFVNEHADNVKVIFGGPTKYQYAISIGESYRKHFYYKPSDPNETITPEVQAIRERRAEWRNRNER